MADPDPVSRRRSGNQKLPRETFNTFNTIQQTIHRGSLIVTLLASRRLDPTSFTRKLALQTVGGGRSSIRSTTRINLPPSICTRRSDGFCHGRNLLVAVIEKSPITRQTDGGDAAEARRWAAAVREAWRGGGGGQLGGLGFV
ncbi:hypothetical protein F511_15930 [Dorcoceras hygrometricum]|uniref:Uncharacterized protein n=1 Tax=Dorcoceras hygrometricum TaxID=472368 RepID=A0A2Z7C434_9LAMI|nr:hypothetical protein F511_15930 [Dorcoceras hygrometricum]